MIVNATPFSFLLFVAMIGGLYKEIIETDKKDDGGESFHVNNVSDLWGIWCKQEVLFMIRYFITMNFLVFAVNPFDFRQQR